MNDQIRISPVRLIGENDEQIGVIDLNEAKQRAQDAELDLVEVAPNSEPPVCRIMDYGKWKYQQKKKEQKAKAHSKQSELKEVRLRPNIDDHDLNFKLNKAREFLGEGHKVQFTMLFRGRQMVHRDLARRQMMDITAQLAEIGKIETAPRQQGRRMTMMLSPDRKKEAKGGKSGKSEKAEQREKGGDARTPAAEAPQSASA